MQEQDLMRRPCILYPRQIGRPNLCGIMRGWHGDCRIMVFVDLQGCGVPSHVRRALAGRVPSFGGEIRSG
jgi:hypothetical protein